MIDMDNLMTPNISESSESALVLSLGTPASLRTIELVQEATEHNQKCGIILESTQLWF
jgi:hypothetical protein